MDISPLRRVTLATTKLTIEGQRARHVLLSLDGRSIELTMEQWTWLLSHPQIYLRDPPPKPSA